MTLCERYVEYVQLEPPPKIVALHETIPQRPRTLRRPTATSQLFLITPVDCFTRSGKLSPGT